MPRLTCSLCKADGFIRFFICRPQAFSLSYVPRFQTAACLVWKCSSYVLQWITMCSQPSTVQLHRFWEGLAEPPELSCLHLMWAAHAAEVQRLLCMSDLLLVLRKKCIAGLSLMDGLFPLFTHIILHTG